ncbi:MAG: NADP-dependent oxidoreductase [Rhodospirillales bacterium]|nr:NADP-dependent oxidoreductase [Rhodospirillales bacterium]
MNNRRIVLARRPVGAPVASDMRLEEVDVPPIGEGELLLDTLFLSLDPYMRGRMSEEKSYAPPVAIGDPIVGRTISRVVQSRNADYATGDLVMANSGWQSRVVSNGTALRKLDPAMRRPTLALGVLGSSGFAAYIGLLEIGMPKPGDTVAVAAATGAVGATVVQLARLKGARTIAIAGGTEKVEYARNVLQADVALDHRAPDFAERLKAASPEGIDVYFENVGGDVLLSVLPLLKDGARVPVCGLIAWYNLAAPPDGPDHAPALMRTILRKRLRVQGYVVTDWLHRQESFLHDMTRWIEDGSIVYREHVVDGLENAQETFIGLLEGRNFGKAVIKVAD